MSTHIRRFDGEQGLARLGLFLGILLALLADRGYAEHVTWPTRMSGFLARRAIDGIAVIGWVADRLPTPRAGGLAWRTAARQSLILS